VNTIAEKASLPRPAYTGSYMLALPLWTHHELSVNPPWILSYPCRLDTGQLAKNFGPCQADIASQSVILRKSCPMLLTEKASSYPEFQW